MSKAQALIGNSSSALVEAPYFKLPAINIGKRQLGRDREENVVDAKRNVFKDVKNYYVELAQKRYSVGAGTLLETINARVKYTTARIGLVRAIYNVKIARAKLEGAVGVEAID